MEGRIVRVWVHYDLGLTSSFEVLYQYLANNDAEDCGNGMATFKRYWDGQDDIHQSIKVDLEELGFVVAPRDRIYVIAPRKNTTGPEEVMGGFIVGGRRTPAWDAYSKKDTASYE